MSAHSAFERDNEISYFSSLRAFRYRAVYLPKISAPVEFSSFFNERMESLFALDLTNNISGYARFLIFVPHILKATLQTRNVASLTDGVA